MCLESIYGAVESLKAIHGYQISPFLLRSPNIKYRRYLSSQIPQQQNTLQVATTSLNEPIRLYSNVHISLDHFHNSFCMFQILPQILPAKKNEATQFHYNYQTQHA